jgi:hypothetical protein
VSADSKLSPVGLDDDTSVHVCSIDGDPRRRSERREGLGARMPVVVVPTARDHRDSRPKHTQLVFESRVCGTVMRDLEDLDPASGRSAVTSDRIGR